MTSIWSCGRPRRECTSEIPSRSSSSPKSSHDKIPVNPPAVEPLVAKYIEEDLQKILRTVFKARASPSDGACEKPLKVRSSDVYCGKFHIECYNICQQCEDHFATAGAKDLSRILFAISFLCNYINFCWQQYQQKYEAESFVLITWKEYKTFFYQSLGNSWAFVNSYWAIMKKNSQYHQEDVLDWAAHLEHLEAVF